MNASAPFDGRSVVDRLCLLLSDRRFGADDPSPVDDGIAAPRDLDGLGEVPHVDGTVGVDGADVGDWVYERALEAADTGVWALDLRTHASPVRSPRHDRIFGYDEPLADWSFERFVEHVHPDDRGRIERSFEAAHEAGEWEFECRIVRADGVERRIAACGEFHSDDAGDPTYAFGVVRDVTDRTIGAAARRRRDDRLHESVVAVAHDLRNPLATARGYLMLARRETTTEHLDRIEHGLNRAERLVADLLAVVRDDGDVTDTEPVRLSDAVASAWRVVEDGRTTATLVYAGDDSFVVDADPSRLARLLENVLSNAIEHGGPDVTVTVETTSDGFAVEDDGDGVPGAVRDRVFEWGHSTRTDGTGLGLAIVEQVAASHGWTVTVAESAAGGARFVFSDVVTSSSGD